MTPTTDSVKTVATPRDDYVAYQNIWKKCRAVCGSEDLVKQHDMVVHMPSNFLIPFSPSMTQAQFNFLKSEAELPGISAEFKQLLIGALLRKEPEVVLPKDAPAGAQEWIMNQFGVDGTPLFQFMTNLVEEEIETTHGFVQVDMGEDKIPFTTLYPAEAVINWTKTNQELTQIILAVQEDVGGSEFHPVYQPIMHVHELVNGKYQVRVFRQKYDENGKVSDTAWVADANPVVPEWQGEPLDFIPIWPSSGEADVSEPFLLTIVNKEVALYNKTTRRNHLLLGAATYTPYVSGVKDEADFKKIVNSGLGSWLHLPDTDAKVAVLEPPTDALQYMESSIAAGIEEMARLGVRMLSPETAQSGVALQLRNAAQTARLGTLNARISVIMTQVIATMLNWRYNKEYTAEDIKFKMQDDTSAQVVGEGWLRLATEWYETNKIPRSVWIQLLKQNDVLPDDYNDEDGKKEIDKQEDEFSNYAEKVKKELENGTPT